MKTVSEHRSFEGVQGVYDHDSVACGGVMRFSVFTPPQAENRRRPTLFWLSGLTCTHANFTEKAGAQRIASELGLVVVAPDTSPRGEDVADDDAFDLGQGAGFYVDATERPWAGRFAMWRYVTQELPELIFARFPADPARTGVFGHSMGGHGALTAHLRAPELFRSCSAFAPIVAPSQVPWGRKAFTAYLGADETTWAAHDATRLVAERPSRAEILIEQGEDDPFLAQELRPELFTEAAAAAGQRVALRMRPGYDHSYYFIASFIEDHLRWHAERLV